MVRWINHAGGEANDGVPPREGRTVLVDLCRQGGTRKKEETNSSKNGIEGKKRPLGGETLAWE